MFSRNQDHLAEKCNNAVFALNAYSKHAVGRLQPYLAMQMFDSQIAPIMQYTSEMWFQNKECPILEIIHLAYMKNTMRIKPYSASKTIYAEFGRFPQIIKQKYEMIKHWKRFIEMRNDYYVKKAYNSTLELHDLGQTNWCTYVNAVLKETHFQQAWVNQSMDNRQFAMLKDSLHRSYMAECIRNIHDSLHILN